MATNPYRNKVIYNGNTLIDLTDATATADKILQGFTAYGADGSKLTGTATGGGGGSVTQDQDGFIVLPPDGSGSPSVGGLVYETGTWTPSEDTANYVIPFSNTHTTAPFYYAVSDNSDSYSSTGTSNYLEVYYNFHQLFGVPFYINDTGTYLYATVTYIYRNTSATAVTGSAPTQVTYPYTESVDNSSPYSRFWATETGIRAYTNSASRYWRSGRTYKWIAVWAPTT